MRGLESIEHVGDVDALLMRLEGEISVSVFVPIYDYVLQHSLFEPGLNFIWDCTEARIGGIDMEGFKVLYSHVKQSQGRRARSRSAWVFRDLDDYCLACAVNASLGTLSLIKYEIFRSVPEAKEWVSEARGVRVPARSRDWVI